MDPQLPNAAAHLLIGQARPFGPNGEPSAIDKQAVATPLRLSVTGFAGDEQGDPSRHGGPDKAVHHYPFEHYAAWCRELPDLAERFRTGGFGENISTVGLTEQNVCVGDQFSLGTARIQVAQARQPCWKLGVRFGIPDMPRRVQASARTGWYYRVLEPGMVTPGDELRLIDRPHPDWPLARLLHHLYVDRMNADALHAIAALAVLPSSFRQLAEKRLQSSLVEDWSRRLNAPVAGAQPKAG
jgi:MOSC domain-containing protein YiiM